MSEYTMERELRTDLIHAVAKEARRQDYIIGRHDAGGFESFGRIKARLEKATETFKPLDKTLKEYWEVVSGEDNDLQGSFLREMETETLATLKEMAWLAAAIERAMWALNPWEERKVGQMSLDDLAEEEPDMPPEDYDPEEQDAAGGPRLFDPVADEETGEILDDDEDLAPASEVLGSEE